mmetsp:Transcript_60050/g.178048  ORF Transcript_60050/g.178048 Transcript_60050/m.178048 type:complete len:1051 (-) Transcript_60050:224-3376(-)
MTSILVGEVDGGVAKNGKIDYDSGAEDPQAERTSVAFVDEDEDEKELSSNSVNAVETSVGVGTGKHIDWIGLGEDDTEDGVAPTFVDHFSLGVPSSTFRFRNTRYVLYDGGEDQFLLEDRPSDLRAGNAQNGNDVNENSAFDKKNGRHVITMKRAHTDTFGLRLLRATYTLAALLVLGFLFVFCFQVILFLFLNMPADSGGTRSDPNVNTGAIIGAILSIPIFLYGFASIMSIGVTFVEDTWSGHVLFRSILHCPVVLMEWGTFILFLGIPGLTLAATLLAKNDTWWEQTAKCLVCCIFFFMIVFAFSVVCCEVSSCARLIRLHKNPNAVGGRGPWWREWARISQQAILLRQRGCYSGERSQQYIVHENEEPPYSLIEGKEPIKEKEGIYSALTRLSCCGSVVETFDPPNRSYTMEEIKGVTPFVTKQNWSLERMWCQDYNARRAFVNSGPSALRSGQVNSSLACAVVGSVLIVLILCGVLVWLEMSALVLVLSLVLVILCCLSPMVLSFLRLYREYYSVHRNALNDPSFSKKDEEMAKEQGGKNDKVTMSVWETVRFSQPRNWACWTLFSFEVIFLFLWPLIALYASGNWKVGTIFLFLGGISEIRIYFNAGAVLKEIGTLDTIQVTSRGASLREDGSVSQREAANRNSASGRVWSILSRAETDKEKVLRKKARISEIVSRISHSKKTYRFMWVFALFVIVIFLMVYSAFNQEEFEYKIKGTTLASNFSYPAQVGAQYPTCQLTKSFTLPGQKSTALMDFSFLAGTAFAGPEEATSLLDTWFGTGKIVDEYKFVNDYRVATDTVGGVSFKLYSFSEYEGYGVISIRGSETLLDWVVDVQLWGAAALAQLVRAFIPLGWIWTPIFDELVYVVNSVESANLKRVAYYKTTTQFINDVLSGEYGGGKYHTLRVTGASLGGGLAIITGAQTGAYTVAISGLNAMLSRQTFDPPVTKEQLDTRVFNVIPDRDPIAHIDDRAQLFQETQCRAPKNDFWGCHSMWRSVCELAYQCGSEGRPILCWCVTKYGYPKPEPTENSTMAWEEACASDYESS